jgi:hypothetical protein
MQRIAGIVDLSNSTSIHKFCYSLCKFQSNGLGQVPMVGSCEHFNEPSGSIKRQGISLLAE